MKIANIKNKNGITLIALIVTIILMLILAGVVISLTIGENGLINTAKYAVQKNSEVTAKEKLELALADLQAHKYTNETYNENEYIDSYLKNEGMQVIEDIVTVDGWKFEIDRSVPQIGESLGQEEIKSITISTPYVGTSSFTTKVQYVTNEEDVESYTYMLNEEEIATNANTEYTLEDTLDPETTYSVKVIAKYKNGLTVESNVVTIKTEKRTYLYNNGDECTDITGGWVLNRYCVNQDGKFYYSYLPDSGWNGARTVNAINFDSYKKIGIIYNDENTAVISFIISDYPFSTTSWLQWTYTGSISSFNLEDISSPHIFWFYAPDEGKCLSINSIWLEK